LGQGADHPSGNRRVWILDNDDGRVGARGDEFVLGDRAEQREFAVGRANPIFEPLIAGDFKECATLEEIGMNLS
jgi:hypothetical protein